MVLALVGGTAQAGNPPPPKETQGMACMVGSWKGTGSMTMGTNKVDGVKMTYNCKRTSGDWGVACTGVMTGIPGMGRLEETDLFGYDPGAGKYHWFAVTNDGETHDHVGTPGKGDTLEFVYNGVQEGKPFKEVLQLTFRGPKESMLDLRAETFVDAKSTSVMTATAHK
jgi:hypothetical protein